MFCNFAKKMLAFSDSPNIQSFQIPGVRHIPAEEAYRAIIAGIALPVDVRDESEIIASSIDCERLLIHPILNILNSINELPKQTPLIIVSGHGQRSTKVANLFNIQGFAEVYNLDGGMHAWVEAGMPTTGSTSGCGCSCGCH